MDAVGGLIVLGMVIFVLVGLFLLFRAAVLWYWKLDRIVALLESISTKLGPEPAKGSTEKVVGTEY